MSVTVDLNQNSTCVNFERSRLTVWEAMMSPAVPDPAITNLLDAEPSRRSSVSAETVTPVPEDSDHAPLQFSMTFSV